MSARYTLDSSPGVAASSAASRMRSISSAVSARRTACISVSSWKMRAAEANARKCDSGDCRLLRIMSTRWTGSPSRDSNSMPLPDLPKAATLPRTASCLACGTAIPRPMPVVPSRSRAKTADAAPSKPSRGMPPASTSAAKSSARTGIFVVDDRSGITAPRRIIAETVIAPRLLSVARREPRAIPGTPFPEASLLAARLCPGRGSAPCKPSDQHRSLERHGLAIGRFL